MMKHEAKMRQTLKGKEQMIVRCFDHGMVFAAERRKNLNFSKGNVSTAQRGKLSKGINPWRRKTLKPADITGLGSDGELRVRCGIEDNTPIGSRSSHGDSRGRVTS